MVFAMTASVLDSFTHAIKKKKKIFSVAAPKIEKNRSMNEVTLETGWGGGGGG